MKKIFHVGLLCAFLSSSAVLAMGRARGQASLSRNPYIMTLQHEFADASKAGIADGIEMGKKYNCRIFYALSQSNVTTPDTGATWYQFASYGDLFLDNLAASQIGRIRTYAINPSMGNELLGESSDRSYFEAIRVNALGDLIIEGSTPPEAWAKTILADLGLNSSVPEWNNSVTGLALASAVLSSNNLVVSYTYCPLDTATSSRRLGLPLE